MIDIPKEIKALFRSDNDREETVKHVRLKFYEGDIDLLFPDEDLFPADDLYPMDAEPYLVIGNDQIAVGSLNLEENLCMEYLKFGECCASSLEIVVADVKQDLTGKEFMLTIEVGGYEMAMGIFKVEFFTRQADRRLKKILAFNRMRRFQSNVTDWYNSLTFPMTLKQLRGNICKHLGLKEVDTVLPLDDMQVTKTIEPSKLYGLDVLRSICEINGGFGQMDRMGRVKYVLLGRSGLFPSDNLFPDEDLYPTELENVETIPHYKQSATEYEDYVVEAITQLKIRQEEGDVGVVVGDGDNPYIIQGNFLVYGKSAEELEKIAAVTFEKISGRVYRPCSIVSPALPWVETGDGIVCYTTDDVIETYCIRRSITGIQAMMDTFDVTGQKRIEEDFSLKSRIIQSEGKSAVLKHTVEEVSVKVTDLKEFTESQLVVMSDQILAEVTRAKTEEEKLSASIKVQADQISLKVSKGQVSSEISVESDEVRITGNRLIVDSTNFKLDRDGTIRCRNGRFTGYLESTNFTADSDGVTFGDFSVSADGGNVLRSQDGAVAIYTAAGGPFGKYPAIQLSDKGGTTTLSDHHLETPQVLAKRINGDCELRGKNWWSGYTLFGALDYLYNKINDMGG